MFSNSLARGPSSEHGAILYIPKIGSMSTIARHFLELISMIGDSIGNFAGFYARYCAHVYCNNIDAGLVTSYCFRSANLVTIMSC